MEIITRTIAAEEDGSTVRHILKAKLHFSSHAISRLTRAENGIRLNGQHARTVDIVRAGDVLEVLSGDLRQPKAVITPGNWPLPVVWEDGHLLVVNKPAGMTAHASNFLPDTPTVAGALAWQRGADFLFQPVNRLDKGTTGLMVVAKRGYVHDLLRRALHSDRFQREYRAVCMGCISVTLARRTPSRGPSEPPQTVFKDASFGTYQIQRKISPSLYWAWYGSVHVWPSEDSSTVKWVEQMPP